MLAAGVWPIEIEQDGPDTLWMNLCTGPQVLNISKLIIFLDPNKDYPTSVALDRDYSNNF